MTINSNPQSLIDELHQLWSHHNFNELASDAVKHLTSGSATDWGIPADVESPITPITLGGGIPDAGTLPKEELLDAMRRALDVPDDEPLRYGGGIGYEPLRHELAKRYTRDRHISATSDHFLLTNGSADAIDLICGTFLSPGDIVISEAPTFSGTLRTFRGHQAEILSVGIDREGMIIDELEQLLSKLETEGRRAKIIYVISNCHNPAGISMSHARRESLLRTAAKFGCLIVDDDAYGELYYTPEPPVTLSELSQGQGVITVGTFSKIIATGLRVGWVFADPSIIEQIVRVRFDMGNSPMLHHMLWQFMQDGRLDKHIVNMRSLYSEKLESLASALHEYCEPYMSFQKPTGGFFLWAQLHENLDALEVQREGIKQGVIFANGHGFFPDHHDLSQHLRFAFSWVPHEDIQEGAQRLAKACAIVSDNNRK